MLSTSLLRPTLPACLKTATIVPAAERCNTNCLEDHTPVAPPLFWSPESLLVHWFLTVQQQVGQLSRGSLRLKDQWSPFACTGHAAIAELAELFKPGPSALCTLPSRPVVLNSCSLRTHIIFRNSNLPPSKKKSKR